MSYIQMYLTKKIFATHKDGTVPKDWKIYEAETIDLINGNLGYWVNNEKLSWIFNIDIDYFFTKDSNEKYIQFLTDEYILCLVKELKKFIHRVEVITIALSPVFCGDIDNTNRVAEIFLNELS